MLTPAGFVEYTRQRLKRRIGAYVALIILSILALMAAAIFKARDDALTRARLEASFISAALAEDVEGLLGTLACASDFVKERIEKGGNSGFLFQLKQQIAKSTPSLAAISIIGADGRLRETSAPGDVALLDFSEASFFRGVRDSKSEDLQIGKPLTIANRVIIPATRRLEKADGSFAGAVLFSIDPEMGSATYRKVDLGKTGSIKVADKNGIIFAGYSLPRGFDPSLTGRPFNEKASIPWRMSATGSFFATSPDDGVERVYFWRKIPGFPIVALVGLGKAEALQGANRQALLIASLGIFPASLLLFMTVLLKREFARRFKHALALDSHRRKLREANERLAAAKKQAEEDNKSKSNFLVNISHELRTPLNAILGFAEIIRDQMFGNNPDRYSSYASDIYESGAYLLNLAGGLLDLSKIEAGKFELVETLINTGEVTRECLRVVKTQAATRGVALVQMQRCDGISLYADATALKQILINLLTNAIKFTRNGGSAGISWIVEPDGSLTLTVKDTGIGMTGAEIREALEPFGQVRNTLPARSEGTGLGLPLVARLAELHGGSLTIESTPGYGTAGSVRFPAWRVRVDGTPANSEAQAHSHRPY
jgi:signal transduction histidine kinase